MVDQTQVDVVPPSMNDVWDLVVVPLESSGTRGFLARSAPSDRCAPEVNRRAVCY
jgi:hypothetical protein